MEAVEATKDLRRAEEWFAAHPEWRPDRAAHALAHKERGPARGSSLQTCVTRAASSPTEKSATLGHPYRM